ncbi:hypothetical protein C5614_29860 [Massilia phosphatilytica]|nr:hypothetical protein C5614_29860 [Massilia phosphatilytica]
MLCHDRFLLDQRKAFEPFRQRCGDEIAGWNPPVVDMVAYFRPVVQQGARTLQVGHLFNR